MPFYIDTLIVSLGRIRFTDDQQIDIMKTNLQTSGQMTGLSWKPYDFYKQIDLNEFYSILNKSITSGLRDAILVTLKDTQAYSLVLM
jgi:hypothetical protein